MGMTVINKRRSELGLFTVVTIATVCLLAGHLLLKEYMPNAAIGVMGFLFLVVMFSYVVLVRRDLFAFTLIVYICSHFSYADNQGGLWNLLAFGMLVSYALIGRRGERFRRSDPLVSALLIVLVLFNVFGWVIKNPVPLITKVSGATAFLSYILMFRMVSNLRMTEERVRAFFVVTALMLLVSLVIALNQRYAIFNFNTPLLGAYSAEHGRITYGSTNAQGPFRNSELFGEYAVLMLALLIPLLSSTATQRSLRMKVHTILLMVLASGAAILLTSTRAAAILAVVVIAINYFTFAVRPLAVLDAVRRQVWLILVVAVSLPIVGVFVGLKSLGEDFAEIADREFTIGSVVSGEAINRGPLIKHALDRLSGESWIIGHGYGTPRSNRWAWFDIDSTTRTTMPQGYHNLYLSLPMVYGWLGSLAFIALILLTGFRAFTHTLRYRRRRNYLVALSFGFVVFWLVFLADQYKISILRNLNYHMLFWIWLGLTHATLRTLREEGTKQFEKQSHEI
jgi:O-antigen ligase